MKFSSFPVMKLLSFAPLATYVSAQDTLEDVAAANGLSIFLQAAMTTQQIVALQQQDTQLTILAPSDEAFAKLQESGTLDWLLRDDNIDSLSYVLGFHFMQGEIFSTDLDLLEDNGKTFIETPVVGGVSTFTVNGPLNSANIVQLDLMANNGVLHIIDEVLLPEPTDVLPSLPSTIIQTVQNNAEFSALVKAVELTNLQSALMSTDTTYTLFAPTNNAFDDMDLGVLTYLRRFPNMFREVLLYHVVPGELKSTDLSPGIQIMTLLGSERLEIDGVAGSNEILINNVSAIVPTGNDIVATNGIVHAINEVLIPSNMVVEPTIADVATETGQFNTLLAAIEEANLVSALNAPGPFTVFAPNDAAFDKVSNLDSILANDSLLTLILQYHVVMGNLGADDLTDGQTLTTLAGQRITINKSSNGAIMINGDEAQVVGEPITGSNGIIHTIDEVLIPTTSTPPDGSDDTKTQAPASSPPVQNPGGNPEESKDNGSAASQQSLLLVGLAAITVVVAGFL